ncbi:hypothetical protein [Streptomyces sp. NPDC056069]|uniref:hypothetical protein n=1 Tax=Streptomyces sp. NPDC056069 TaxID=3345702 RepID=UPI0035DD984C
MLIIDGFVKKVSMPAGGGQYTGTSGKIGNCQIRVFAALPRALDRIAGVFVEGMGRPDRELPGGEDPPTSWNGFPQQLRMCAT